MKRFPAILALPMVFCLLQSLFAEGSPDPKPVISLPADQIGAAVSRLSSDSSGRSLSVMPGADGAQVQCVLQRLNGRVTTGGLWLTSTVNGTGGGTFRVMARTLGRSDAGPLAPFVRSGC